MEERIYQRAGVIAACRMHHHARGFVNHHQGRIFIENFQGYIFSLTFKRHRVNEHYFDTLSGAHMV